MLCWNSSLNMAFLDFEQCNLRTILMKEWNTYTNLLSAQCMLLTVIQLWCCYLNASAISHGETPINSFFLPLDVVVIVVDVVVIVVWVGSAVDVHEPIFTP